MTRTWTPTTPNGWWPRLHAVGDRIFLTFGNTQCWLAEFAWIDGDLVCLQLQCLEANMAWSGWWIRPGVLTYRQEGVGRFEVDVLLGVWKPVKTDDDPALVEGNDFTADAGHWAAWTSNGRVVRDGHVFDGKMASPALAGTMLAAGRNYPNIDAINVYEDTTLKQTLPWNPSAGNQLTAGPLGHIVYGIGQLFAIDPAGFEQPCNVTPWRWEGTGPILRHPDGSTWIVTWTFDPSAPTGYVLLRPWPNGGTPGQPVLQVEAPACIHVSVLPFGDEWLIATSADRGQLLLQAVPQATPMQVLKPRLADLGRPSYQGYYYAAGRYGDFTPVQNCTVLSAHNFGDSQGILPANTPARMRAAARQAGAIFIGTDTADFDAMRDDWGLVHGIVLGEHPDTAGMAAEATAARARLTSRGLPAKPIVATVMPDQLFTPGWRMPAGVDALAVEIYFDGPARTFGDMLKAVARRVDQVIDRTGAVPVILIAQAYDRRNQAWRDDTGRESLDAIQAGVFEAQRTHPTVVGVWRFAYGRDGGVLGFPSLEAWGAAAVAATARPAGLPMASQPAAPLAVTITSYTPDRGQAPLTVKAFGQVTQGQADRFTWRWRTVGATMWTVAAVNPASDQDHTFVFPEAGAYEISLAAAGPGSRAETGRQRLITVTRKEKPMQFVDVADEDIIDFTGKILLAMKQAKPDRPDADIIRDANYYASGYLGLRGAGRTHVEAVFITETAARTDARVDAVTLTDDEVIAAAARFKAAYEASGRWQRQTLPENVRDGMYWQQIYSLHRTRGKDVEGALRAMESGLAKEAGLPDPWPTPGPDPVKPGVLARRAGLVRKAGQCLADDGGNFLAIGTSLFPLAWLLKFDPDRLKANLAWLKGRVHYVRAFAVVGPKGGWEDRTIDPRWGDWDQLIAQATSLAYDDYGIRVEWCIFAGLDNCPTPADREHVVRRFGAAVAPIAQKVFAVELANEGYQNGFGDGDGPAELKRLAGIVRQLLPNLVATTDANTEAQVATFYQGSQATYGTLHPDRSQVGTGDLWRPTRQTWDAHFFGDFPSVRAVDEPIGPRSSGAMDDDPLRQTMLAATGFATGCAMFTLHTGAGVRMGGQADKVGGKPWLPREANLFDVPKLDPILAGLATVATNMPADCPNWQKDNGNKKFPAYPFDVTNMMDESKVLRGYCAQGGGRFVIPVLQIRAALDLVARKRMSVVVHDPLTWAVLDQADLDTGQKITLHGSNDQPAGVILMGTYR